MIPRNITQEHVLRAIEEIERNGVPRGRNSRKSILLYGGKSYPPKYVISLANKYANGVMLDSSRFSGGQETNRFLERLGFRILDKTTGVTVPPPPVYNIAVKEMFDYPFNELTRRTQQCLKVYEICAEDFLEFAKEDSKGQNLRSLVNALGNIKRAIECRIDTLLYNFCLHKKSEKEGWNFPKKVEVLRELGIVAPDILKRTNKKRNQLEHQYVKPTKDDVDDALDVATLFLGATNELAIIDYTSPNDFRIELKHKEGFVKLIDYKNNVEKIAKIDNDDGWIEFAKTLSGLLKRAQRTISQ